MDNIETNKEKLRKKRLMLEDAKDFLSNTVHEEIDNYHVDNIRNLNIPRTNLDYKIQKLKDLESDDQNDIQDEKLIENPSRKKALEQLRKRGY